MARRLTIIAALVGTLLAACSAGGADPTATLPPTPTAASANPTRTPESAAGHGYTSDTDTILTAVAEQEGSATVAPVPDEADLARAAREFDARVRDSIRALRKLPGYTYTVTDPLHAPWLTLKGTVAAPDTREWVVYEYERPEHVVARWRLVEGRAYTDIAGAWEEIDAVPFDTTTPLSYATFAVPLFEPVGDVQDAGVEEANAADREATLYTIYRQLGDAATDPNFAGRSFEDSLYVAKEGGYLLAYEGPPEFGYPHLDAPLRIDVTPLETAPKIARPGPGERVFAGNPPSWRVAALGQARLERLRSYRFTSTESTYGLNIRVRGQVSEERGVLAGRIPDQYAEQPRPDEDGRIDPDDVRMVDLELLYEGPKVWLRERRGEWRRVSTNLEQDREPEYNALELLSSMPTAPPESVIGSREGFGGVLGVEPVGGVGVLGDAELIGAERVNGVRVLHYSGTANGVTASTMSESLFQADIWLDAENLHVVRTRANFTAFRDAPATANEEFGIDVFDANEPVRFRAPER